MWRAGLVVVLAACGRIGFDAVGGPLAIAPRDSRTNVNSVTQFTASGGEPPYTFSIETGAGEIASDGAFRAGMYPGVARIRVDDDAGDSDATDITIDGDFLYSIGGSAGGAPVPDIYRSADGIDWQLVGALPAARAYGMLFVYDDALIYAGGADNTSGGAIYAEIWRSLDAVTWMPIGTLAQPTDCSAHAVFKGRMWMITGAIAGGNLRSIVTSTDGTTWNDEGSQFPIDVHCAELLVHRDSLWLVAGHASTGLSDAVFVSDDGVSWTQQPALPAAGEYHATTVFADRMWVAGGNGLGNRVVSSQDGLAWTDADSLMVARSDAALIEHQGMLWVIGGLPSQTLHSPNGTGWTPEGTFPASYTGARVVRFTPMP